MKTPHLPGLLQKTPVIAAIVAMVAVTIGLKILSGPPSTPTPIILSRATSYFTEQLLPDGYVDYATALNQLRDYEVPDDENAALLLLKFAEDYPIPVQEWQGVLLLDVDRWFPNAEDDGRSRNSLRFALERRLALAPWTAEKFPNVAAFLASHEATFQAQELAAEKSGLFLPLKPSTTITESWRAFDNCSYQGRTGDLYRVMVSADFWSRAMIHRAMLKAGTEPIDEALRDLRVALKTANLIQQQPRFSFFQRSIFMRHNVVEAIARIATVIVDQRELDSVAKFVAEMGDASADTNACRQAVLTERCEELSSIMALNAGDERMQMQLFFSDNYRKISETARQELHLRLNVNPILEQINLQFDTIEHVLTSPDLRWQRRQLLLLPGQRIDSESIDDAMNRMEAVRDAVVRHPASKAAVDPFITQHINFGLRLLWKMTPRVQMESHCWNRFANIAVGLQRLKIRDGVYPMSLRRAGGTLPLKSDETFEDPFGVGDFVYLLKDDGREFELSSVGLDGSVTLDNPPFPDQPRLETADSTENPFMKLPERGTQ